MIVLKLVAVKGTCNCTLDISSCLEDTVDGR